MNGYLHFFESNHVYILKAFDNNLGNICFLELVGVVGSVRHCTPNAFGHTHHAY